ncbi:synaptonemal complex protein 2-like [Melopsittacus undulatus]|uniref:synaptonemal complex protein 2-like n=1 Tax=Melopsittacus undulatus TaxID=13146 RepID=UPI00146C371B|nr:synaptonemal complex protein 2-like [Melopsittacus undulatus]
MAEEQEREELDSEVDGNVVTEAEDYLKSLLAEAFKEKGFQEISELLQGGEIEPPQKYKKSLLNQLDKILRKELDKNEFQNVSLMLNCIQLYFKNELQDRTSLFIEQGLVEKLVSWFERAREFVNLIEPNENKLLMQLLEDFFDSALVCMCTKRETRSLLAVMFTMIFPGQIRIVNLFLPELGHLVTAENIYWSLRQEALKTLNSILGSLPREERKKFPLSEEMCSLTRDLAKTILEVGDYDLQVALSEALCRLMTKKWRDDLVHHWFEDNYLAEAFKEIKDGEFETDCRKFLNQLNERLEDERRVYSFPCISAFVDMTEVKKPADEKLEKFWIDFNTGTESVTFYVQGSEDALWDSVRVLKEAVRSYSIKEEDGEKIVKINMKTPAAFNQKDVSKIRITFSAEFEIVSIFRKVLGEEKMMINVAEEEPVHGEKQDRQNEAVLPKSTNPQKRKDPSDLEIIEAPPDSLASQDSQQLTGAVEVSQEMDDSDVTMIKVSQQTDMEDGNEGSAPEDEAVVSLPPSAKKLKTPSRRMKAKPSEKPIEEASMKESTPKVLPLSSQNNATWEKGKRKKSLANQRTEGRKEIYDFENSDSASHEKVAEAKERFLGQKVSSQSQSCFNYRKHLFSESNNENTSTGQSEKSWILDFQKQPLPKLHDYTRKRTRVRSKLKVLPVSSASSGSDHQTKKVFHNASAELSREEESFKRKDSDVLSGTATKKLKFSRWERNHLSTDNSYKSRKLVNSVEKEVEIQTGQEMDNNVDDVFLSEMPHEDFGDLGVITAFESFIGQLKKLFLSRYKRMETSAQNALRTSEKKMSLLLSQIHECRLTKLETFQKTLVEDLASLEKETQLLASMEKDAMDFWNAQLLKVNSFCNQQKQRIQSVDSALGQTVWDSATTTQNTTVKAQRDLLDVGQMPDGKLETVEGKKLRTLRSKQQVKLEKFLQPATIGF